MVAGPMADAGAARRRSRSSGAQGLAVVVALGLLVAAIHALHRSEPPGTMIGAARFVADPAPEPPPADDPRWEIVTLPDERPADVSSGIAGWYALELPLAAPERELAAAYLPSVWSTAVVVWNDARLAPIGDPDGRRARNWQDPALVLLPAGWIRPGPNRLLLRISAAGAPAGLGPVWVGPAGALRAASERRRTLTIAAPRAMTLALALLAGFMIALWRRRRGDAIYAWFALVLASFALYTGLFGARSVPMPPRAWIGLRVIALGWFVITAAIVTHRFFAIRRPRVERALIAAGLTATILIPVLAGSAPASFDLFAARLYPALSLAFGLYPAACAFPALRRRSDLESRVLVGSGLALIALGCHDVLMVNGIVSRADGYYVLYGAPVLLVAFAWVLLGRFADALSDAEALNRELEERVARKHAELERNYERLRDVERERVLGAERERIMRDMHDGVGGVLVSSLARLEAGTAEPHAVADGLRAALEELRLAIDSLSPVDGDPATVLGIVRARLGDRLGRSGIALDWRVGDLPVLPDLGPERVLHLIRIVQEAIANAIRHSNARTLVVAAELADTKAGAAIVVRVSDDGRGLPSGPFPERGLANMRRRAQLLGGELSVSSSSCGTTVELRLPVAGDLRPPV
jgi:signal transduction histidine kinase